MSLHLAAAGLLETLESFEVILEDEEADDMFEALSTALRRCGDEFIRNISGLQGTEKTAHKAPPHRRESEHDPNHRPAGNTSLHRPRAASSQSRASSAAVQPQPASDGQSSQSRARRASLIPEARDEVAGSKRAGRSSTTRTNHDSSIHRMTRNASPARSRRQPHHSDRRRADDMRYNEMPTMFGALRVSSPSPVPSSSTRTDAEPSTVPTCLVCYEEAYNDIRFPTDGITPSCTHMDFCMPCLQRHITTSSRSNGWDRLRCPGTNCTVLLTYADVRRHLGPTSPEFAAYDELTRNAALASERNFKWCLGPDCKYGVETTERHLYCPECEDLWCLACGVTWHHNMSCHEYQARKRRENAARRGSAGRTAEEEAQGVIAKTTKGCPKCYVRIERNDGCNHMRCNHNGCGYEFCWQCLRKWGVCNKLYACTHPSPDH